MDLLGSRFVFRQARRAIPAALRFLGVADSVDAGSTLEQGLDNGQCLYRDVRDRVGLIQVLPPIVTDLDDAFDTAPQQSAGLPGPDAALPSGTDDEDADADDRSDQRVGTADDQQPDDADDAEH